MSGKPIEHVLASPSLPSLPAVALEVLDLTRDPEIPLTKLAACVENDPALASRILKTVNSSFYGLSKPCPTITRALAYLGMNTVKSLVLGFSLAESFVDENDADMFGFSFSDLWRCTLYSAAAARLVAKEHTKDTDPDEAFMAALLQDIGMLASATALGQAYTMVVGKVNPGDDSVTDRERETLGFDHVEVGSALASRWKLPAQIVTVIEHHHSVEDAPATEREITRCVAGGRMAAAVLLSEPDDRPSNSRALNDTLHLWFHMDGDDCADFLGRVGVASRELAEMFNVPTAEPTERQAIINEASERLLEHQIKMDQENDRLAREQDRLIHEALTDGLTGIANRKRFDMFLEESFATAQRDDTPMSVILFDADKFKGLNDTLGHQAGDAVLIDIAKRCTACVPESGLLVRYGGEEFAVVLPDADAAEAGRVAESIRKVVRGSPFDLSAVPCKDDEVEVSVSCGVSAREPGFGHILKSAATLLRAADKAVYAAKEAGRNRVRVVRLRPNAEERATAAAGSTDTEHHVAEDAAPAGSLPRVCIVEDDPMQLKLISTPLITSGEYEVETASNAEEAMDLLGLAPELGEDAGRPPSFMLIDLGLPDMDGTTLVARIRNHPAFRITPIVILSACDQASDVAAVMNAGANAFISKDQIADDPKRRVLDIAAFWSRMIPLAA